MRHLVFRGVGAVVQEHPVQERKSLLLLETFEDDEQIARRRNSRRHYDTFRPERKMRLCISRIDMVTKQQDSYWWNWQLRCLYRPTWPPSLSGR
jgi:hypothetical protein